MEGFLEICRDGTTAEWSVRDGLVVRDDAPPDVSCSPPEPNAGFSRLTVSCLNIIKYIKKNTFGLSAPETNVVSEYPADVHCTLINLI